ncbi:MAG: hypothetical protein LBU17_09675 [Treponema sp.]|jgi:hypothetical protein|nr:hypothetical protein [Treponema sp.]
MEYWPLFSNVDMLRMARVITKYVRFLDPAVIDAITKDNLLQAAQWSTRLIERGIDPRLYLWEGSSCCFPGIRRYFGAEEKAFCGKEPVPGVLFQDALELDFNEYPNKIWGYVQGDVPRGYTLMHILGHVEINNQVRAELDINQYLRGKAIYGLFTSPANTVYVPNTFVAIINANPRLRGLLITKQQELYSSVCALVPPLVRILPHSEDGGWKFKSFDWAPCSGRGAASAGIQDFLQYRNAMMGKKAMIL